METLPGSPSNTGIVFHESPMTGKAHTSPSMQDSHLVDIDVEPLNYGLGHFDWTDVDVPGSPSLSQLLSALEIECSYSIPPLSLEEEDTEESQYISNTQLLDLWNGENESLIYEIEKFQSSKQDISGISRASGKFQTEKLPWPDPGTSFHGRSPNPFNELYVFPSPPGSPGNKHRSLDKPLWLTLESRAAELQLKLSKLKPLLGCEHPKILALTEKLAGTYIDQGCVSKAEILFRHIANTLQKTQGPANLETLDAWLSVAYCLQDKGDVMEAQKLLEKLHTAILKLVHPWDNISIKAMFIMSTIASDLSDWHTAEKLLRQVLQVRLSMFGPTYQGTWECISDIGWVLANRGQNSEAEKLLHIVLQLVGKNLDSNGKCAANAFNALALNYTTKGQTEESEDVCRRAIESLEGSLDLDCPQFLVLYGRMAWSILDRGRVPESEVLFRTTVNQCYKFQGECDRNALYYVEGLAIALEQLGRIDEAASMYEHVYFGFLDGFPPESIYVLSVCHGLGQFYQDHGRYDDALNLYQGHIKHIRRIRESEEHEIAMQSAIAWVEYWMKAPEPNVFGARDWYLRHFRRKC